MTIQYYIIQAPARLYSATCIIIVDTLPLYSRRSLPAAARVQQYPANNNKAAVSFSTEFHSMAASLGIKAYIRGISNHPLHTTTSGNWKDKEIILAEYGKEKILMDITAHEDKGIKPKKHDPKRHTGGPLFWLTTKDQWKRVKHDAHRPILEIAKGTIQIIPGKYSLGENMKIQDLPGPRKKKLLGTTLGSAGTCDCWVLSSMRL